MIKREDIENSHADLRAVKAGKRLPSIHPGEILSEEFLEPLGVTQYRLAKAIAVPPRRINEIVKGKRGVTADTAIRFGKYFGTTAAFWMSLQATYDLELARSEVDVDKIDTLQAA